MKEVDISNTETIYDTINKLIKGLLTGILCGYLIIYSLRPTVPNPDFILDIIENKYIFIPLVIINYYLYEYDNLIGTLFLIFIISLIFDYYIFISKELKTVVYSNIDYNKNENIVEEFYTPKEKIKKFIENFKNVLEI
jgi:uncharacterized membrane-anchored protein YitT (DUF2179 family)